MRTPPFVFQALVSSLAWSNASAQQILFHDGFENGMQNWSATGLWNHETVADPCGSQAAPFREGGAAAWYGNEGSCTYETPPSANMGSLYLRPWIDLPANAGSISLRFWSWRASENCWGSPLLGGQWDVHSVTIEAQNTVGSGFIQDLCPPNGSPSLVLPWYESRIDLSGYRGGRVRVSFLFNSIDQFDNGHLGWFVDDVSIVAEPGAHVCPTSSFGHGCPCLSFEIPVAGGCRNSTNQSATLSSSGSAVVASDTLTMTAREMPPGTAATLFQGTALSATGPVTFGDGGLCLSGSLMRLGTKFAPSGSLSWPSSGGASLSSTGLVAPSGGTRLYQVVYRDSVSFCTPATFNLTDAMSVSWMP